MRRASKPTPPVAPRRRRVYFGRVERRLTLGTALGLFSAAAVLHVVIAFTLQGVMNMSWSGGKLPAGEGFMKVQLVPPDPEEEDDPKSFEELEEQGKRLVQNHSIENERRPEDTDLVSEFDHSTQNQTQAPLVPDQRPTPPSQRGDAPDAENAKRPGERSERPSDEEYESDSERGQGQSAANSDLEEDDRGQVSKDEGASSSGGKVGLRGSANDLARTFGRRGSLDYLEDVDQGAENLLNTKRTKYASFFNRVRNAVAQHWHPEVIHAARDPHGKIYGNKTRTTRLRISLNQDGTVHRIWVDRPSGVDYLDEEAIRSVRAAAPFTNPPKQLVDADTGYIDFSFNFILMIDGSKRIFRYKR